VVADRVADYIEEYRLGIRCSGFVPIETLIDNWQGSHDYAPTGVRAVRRLLDAVEIREDDVFVDYGCGKGRSVLLAAERRFRTIHGVEVSSKLLEIARRNLSSFCGTRSCNDIRLHHCDARRFALPPDATVLFFANPFHGDILTSVFANIHQSFLSNQRQLRVIFNNPIHFRKIEHAYPWLTPVRHFSFEQDCTIYVANNS